MKVMGTDSAAFSRQNLVQTNTSRVYPERCAVWLVSGGIPVPRPLQRGDVTTSVALLDRVGRRCERRSDGVRVRRRALHEDGGAGAAFTPSPLACANGSLGFLAGEDVTGRQLPTVDAPSLRALAVSLVVTMHQIDSGHHDRGRVQE
jgi:hypothetical protein